METKAIISGGLREVDQFGQKKSIEGNYKIRVKADPGQGEVQKSDIMTIKHSNVLTGVSVNAPDGVKDVSVDSMTPGTYSLKLSTTTTAPDEANMTGAYDLGGTRYSKTMTMGTTAAAGVAAGASQTYTFKLGGETLGVVKITNNEATNGVAAGAAMDGTATGDYTVTGLEAVKKAAKEKGVTIGALAGIDTAADTVKLTQFDSSSIGDLSITVGSDTTNIFASGALDSATGTEVDASSVFTIDAATTTVNDKNASILFEVTSLDNMNNIVTLKATATVMDSAGNNTTATQDNIVLSEGGTVYLSDIFGQATEANNPSITLVNGMFDAVTTGSKFVMNVTASQDITTSGTNFELSGDIDTEWANAWDDGVFRGQKVKYYLDGASALKDTEVNFKTYILNEKTGDASLGTVTLTTDDTFSTSGKLATAAGNADTLASFTNTYIGKTANGDVRLRDLDKFWNSEGVMMLDDAKKLTLNQGDGKTADIMLYANDTLDEVATKINNAIASGLGQSQYVDDATKFATFVSGKSDLTSEAVPGTFVIRSVVPGAAGEITFSGDQGIIDAFSLNTIQDSKETTYTVDVLDEHTGKMVAQGVKTTGNVLHGVIHENVDVEFGALKGVDATWNGTLKKYTYTSEQQESTLHLADNTTVLQIGANEGEDLGMDIGDMRAHSLGLDGVNVMSHDRAGRSITIIDNAIDKVSTQRAKLGAYQNRLEYTASNLTTASENLTSAESRIRDADMAKEMMQFTKLNIMLQAGNSMLAQANQQPQNVLSLIR